MIGLFNGFIPLVAVQMCAIRYGDQLSLIFTKVLDQMRLGEEDKEVQEATDRAYWERRATKQTLEMTDALVDMVKSLDPELGPKYNKFYVGLAKRSGQPNIFVIFRPKKEWVGMEPRLARSDAIQAKLEAAGLDVMDYDERWGRYRIRLAKGDIEKHRGLLGEISKAAYAESK